MGLDDALCTSAPSSSFVLETLKPRNYGPQELRAEKNIIPS